VIIAAPDEEIILQSAPGKPRVQIKKNLESKANGDIERRLDRMERIIENLVENDRMLRKHGPVVAFNGKEFAKVQKDMDRAMREADIAIRRMPKPVRNDFNFENHFSFKGDGANQRKVLEAQRKALQKQLEVLDRQLESLDQEPEANGDGSEKEAEISEEKEVFRSVE
jgi:predicted ribosome quality control (RQC) complex YloA/Tae2 family protein